MLRVRAAEEPDLAVIYELIGELADYERLRAQFVGSRADLRRHLFGEPRYARALVAEWDGSVAGFALYFYNYSTFLCRPGLYLEDLFVRPRFRKKGIGKALLVHLARVAVEKGCGRYQWQVLDWNTPAIVFYESLGAKVVKEWLTMRVSGEGLRKLGELNSGSHPFQDSDRSL